MRRTVVECRHGKTTPDRSTRRQASANERRLHHLCRDPATMSGRAAAGLVRGHSGTNRDRLGRGPCDGGPTSERLSQEKADVAQPGSQLGRTPTVPAHPGGGRGVLKTLARNGRHWQPGGRFPDSSGFGTTTGSTGQTVGGLPLIGAPWMAQGGARHAPPQEQTGGSGGEWKKNSLKRWKPC